jgi:GAF domain-containing protein
VADFGALWPGLADLFSMLLAEENLDTTLRRVADLAVRTIPNCDAVGTTMLDNGGAHTQAATGGLVYEVDNYQYEIDEGPCLHAAMEQVIVEIPVMSEETRWPRFARHTAERGLQSSLSLPLSVRGEPLGALNLYSHTERAFDDGDRETAVMFAVQAAVALANSQTYEASVRLARQLEEALHSQPVIEQAKGILMGREGCDADQAFELLKTESQRSHRKLRDVAADIVTGSAKTTAPDAG